VFVLLKDSLVTFTREEKKPILLVETACRSVREGAMEPWHFQRADGYDPCEQAG